MAVTFKPGRKVHLESRARDRAAYNAILTVTFAFFVVYAAFARIIGFFRLSSDGSDPKRKSIFAEAWESANSVLPYAFMG